MERVSNSITIERYDIMKDLAIKYNDSWNLSFTSVEKPKITNDNQVLVNIKATGICGTDLGVISGKYDARKGIILGHESSGIVIETGTNVSMFSKGDRVFIDPTYYCGTCKMCRSGRQNLCEMKKTTETGISCDGTFSPYYITEEKFLYKIESDISYSAATLAEPLSCCLTGVNQLRNLRPEFESVVFGGGTIGVLYAYALDLKGLKGSVIEISEKRSAHTASALPEGWKVYSSIEECLISKNIERFDIAVDTTGVMLEKGLSVLNNGGQLVLVGLYDCTMKVNPIKMIEKGLSIIASVDTIDTFGTAAHLLNSKKIDGEKIVTGLFPIDKFDDALVSLGLNMSEKTVNSSASNLKVIIEP